MTVEQQNNSPFRHRVLTLTVPSGQVISEIIDVQGKSILAIETPAALTSTLMTFNMGGRSDGAGAPVVKPFYNVLGTEVQIQVAVDRYIGFAAVDMAPNRFVQIKVDAAEGADRIFFLIIRSI